MPPAVDHVVGADDHLVDAGHLVRRVVDARPVRAMAQQQGVLVGVARAAHEHAHVADPVGGHEAEQVGVERGGALPPRLLDVDRDVAQPQRAHPSRRLERPVPPGHGPGPVEARVLGGGGRRSADREPDSEAGLVDGVHLAVGQPGFPVGGQGGRQLVERLGGVHAPDDLAQARPVLDRRREPGVIGRPELHDLAGRRREARDPLLVAVSAAVDRLEAEVGKEARALLEVGHAVHDPFHAHDRHGRADSSSSARGATRAHRLGKCLAGSKHRCA